MPSSATPVWTTACPDWETRIVERRSLVPFDPLFPDAAAEALDVFESLRMVDVIGKPTFGEACEPFVFDLVAAIFGSYNDRTATRLISEGLLLISKKNGKSTIAAGIMLTALILNWRELGELLILAPTQEVANNSFIPAAAMVAADPELETILRVIPHQRTIVHRETKAELKVIAADTQTVGGKKAGFVLVDELWLFGKKPHAEAMLEEATGGLASRPEGFVIYTTTHSDEPPAGVFKDKLDYARGVRDGEIDDPSFLPMLYEWPEAMIEAQDYLKPEYFYVTNPNIGRSTTAEFIAAKIRKANGGEDDADGDTSSIQVVLAKYLNVEIGLRLRRNRWRGADYWEQAGDPSLTLEALLERSEVAVVGIDGGGLDDLYGLCVAGREKGTDRWLFWTKAWAWPSALKQRKQNEPIMRGFEADGDLVICREVPPPAIDDEEVAFELPQDIREVVEIVAKVKASGLMPEKAGVGVDVSGIPDTIDALAAADIVDPQLLAVRQGGYLSSAIMGLARKLKFGGAVHSGSRMMAWVVANAKEEQGRTTVMVTKENAGSAKIDPLIAVFNACMLLQLNPAAGDGPSVYEERGVLVF